MRSSTRRPIAAELATCKLLRRQFTISTTHFPTWVCVFLDYLSESSTNLNVFIGKLSGYRLQTINTRVTRLCMWRMVFFHLKDGVWQTKPERTLCRNEIYNSKHTCRLKIVSKCWVRKIKFKLQLRLITNPISIFLKFKSEKRRWKPVRSSLFRTPSFSRVGKTDDIFV